MTYKKKVEEDEKVVDYLLVSGSLEEVNMAVSEKLKEGWVLYKRPRVVMQANPIYCQALVKYEEGKDTNEDEVFSGDIRSLIDDTEALNLAGWANQAKSGWWLGGVSLLIANEGLKRGNAFVTCILDVGSDAVSAWDFENKSMFDLRNANDLIITNISETKQNWDVTAAIRECIYVDAINTERTWVSRGRAEVRTIRVKGLPNGKVLAVGKHPNGDHYKAEISILNLLLFYRPEWAYIKR